MATAPTPARARAAVKPAGAAAPLAGKFAPAKAAKSAAAPARVVKPPKPTGPAKPAQAAGEDAGKREKLVRDSFTMPKAEYAALGELKQRTIGLARPAKKGELLRAGVKALAAMDDKALLAALQGVPALKTGRPSAKG